MILGLLSVIIFCVSDFISFIFLQKTNKPTVYFLFAVNIVISCFTVTQIQKDFLCRTVVKKRNWDIVTTTCFIFTFIGLSHIFPRFYDVLLFAVGDV